jgi:serine/threonine protein kinase
MSVFVGNLFYMAPEVLKAEDPYSSKTPYTKAADIYGLAMILHELFGGGRSFFPALEKYKGGNQYYIMMIQTKPEVEPQLKLELLPSAMTDVVQRGVNRDPSKRPSLEEFVLAIKRA